jgi:hypothetical protein
MLLPDEPSEPIFAISVNSEWMHVYSTLDSLLGTRDMDSGPHDAVEFYDVRGRRLAAVYDQSWRLVGLRRAGERADEAAVRRRLLAAVEVLRESIDDRLAKTGTTTVTREEALGHLPDLEGKSLTECYTLLKVVFGDGSGDPDAADDGSFWHNLFCHCC